MGLARDAAGCARGGRAGPRRMVLGRPRGLGRAVHWAERERSGLGRAGLEGLGWPAWELGRSAGLRGERGKEELGWVAWVDEVGREREREQAGLGCLVGLGPVGVFYFPFFPILFLFYFKHHSNLFEFKPNLNSKPYALNQRKLMHQHECTNMFKPREILITRERKFY